MFQNLFCYRCSENGEKRIWTLALEEVLSHQERLEHVYRLKEKKVQKKKGETQDRGEKGSGTV